MLMQLLARFKNPFHLRSLSAENFLQKADALLAQKKYTKAIRACQRAIALQANYATAYLKLGYLYNETNQTQLAINAYQTAMAIEPTWLEPYLKLALLFKKQGDKQSAFNVYQLGLPYHPQNAFLLCETADFLIKNPDTIDKALLNYQQALALNPSEARIYTAIGIVYNVLDKPQEAIALFQQAQQLKPDCAINYANLGLASYLQNKLPEAKNYYEQSIKLDAALYSARLNYAMILLKSGEYAQGWQEYKYRFNTDAFIPLAKPYARYQQWRQNADIQNKTILLFTEQGFGDSIQFIRYVPLIAQKGAHVIVHCEPELTELFATVAGISQIISKKDSAPLPDFDLYSPLLNLPALFSTTLETIPTTIPYLKAEPHRVQYWQNKINPVNPTKIKIGLVWAGSTRKGLDTEMVYVDRRRSVSLNQFALLKEVPSALFYSLQKGPAAEQIQSSSLKIIDYTDALKNFADTAALISQLDLIITVDTAVAHLAAALGKPTWILNRFDGCWRWLQYREDSPWYPTVRLFNQEKPRDWGSVLQQVKQALQELTANRSNIEQRFS